MFFFFFSSRRRHTRSYGDWSSDVCSSDLCPRADEAPCSAATEASRSSDERPGRRSEERRVGKECRSRWSPDHLKKKKKKMSKHEHTCLHIIRIEAGSYRVRLR